MGEAETLSTIAEVSVAFAGFSGVVAAFGRRDPREWPFAERSRFRALIETSIAGALLALFPLALVTTPMSPAFVWHSSSLALVAYVVLSAFVTYRKSRLATRGERSEISSSLLGAVALCDVLIVALNVFNLVVAGTAWPFVLGLLMLVGQAAFFFARMLIATFSGRAA